MAINLPLEEMSIEEKIETMETIWDNLCEKADSIDAPSWHEGMLKDREEGIKRGEDEFVDWNIAKKDIRNKI